MIPLETQHHLSATFPPTLGSARQARALVLTGLRDAGIDQPLLADRLSLVTSELVTNAVLHARTTIGVRLWIDHPDVWLEVADQASGQPNRSRTEQVGTSGRGLMLVDALADAWGVTSSGAAPGKTVWAKLTGAPTVATTPARPGSHHTGRHRPPS